MQIFFSVDSPPNNVKNFRSKITLIPSVLIYCGGAAAGWRTPDILQIGGVIYLRSHCRGGRRPLRDISGLIRLKRRFLFGTEVFVFLLERTSAIPSPSVNLRLQTAKPISRRKSMTIGACGWHLKWAEATFLSASERSDKVSEDVDAGIDPGMRVEATRGWPYYVIYTLRASKPGEQSVNKVGNVVHTYVNCAARSSLLKQSIQRFRRSRQRGLSRNNLKFERGGKAGGSIQEIRGRGSWWQVGGTSG
ncbi:hypothetical protein BDQ17DRAFT_1328186 [Cyathus striatus]|nr:hypothetical protein BDQ17DRAFT_1328186 [Cyathus striatus]